MRQNLLFLAIIGFGGIASALEPQDVFVISNKSLPESVRVAEHYLTARKVPPENHISLPLPTGEDISRADYIAQLREPLREALTSRQKDVKVLLTVYGVPLRIGPKVLTDDEQAELTRLEADLKAAEEEKDASKSLQLRLQLVRLNVAETTASVDSELMLLWSPEYPLHRWVVNPLYFPLPDQLRRQMPPVVMTARLDGPTPDIAMRLVNDAVAVEERGLAGKVYIDARGAAFDVKQDVSGTGYGGYDQSFREAAELLKTAGLDVTLDNEDKLFPADSCPDCAIYTGWYSHASYIPSCKFNQGAVAWHLASSEAITLRDGESKVWCPNLLKDGAAVTIGPVAEPYTIGFPKPAEFFGHLATGEFTVVECYARTAMFASWMGVLVGDPLYNPFKQKPLLKKEDLRTSPVGADLKLKRTTPAEK